LRIRDRQRVEQQLEAGFLHYESSEQLLPGITQYENRLALIAQMVDSIRRVEYARMLAGRGVDAEVADPASDRFDPLKAAVYYRSIGNIDEACWLVFLATHFGKHLTTGWRLLKDVYGALGHGPAWTWDRVSLLPWGLGDWLVANYPILTGDGTPRHFGNHRKYESLRSTPNGTGAVVASYVQWINAFGGHACLFFQASDSRSSRQAFAWLYANMAVHRFGRTAKFDYLTMLSKLQLASIEADSAYLSGATGPLRGARLLVDGRIQSSSGARALDQKLVRLAECLGVGMQEMEDALCNWQKSPNRYRAFRG